MAYCRKINSMKNMKKIISVFLFIFLLTLSNVRAEQFVLSCKLKVSALHMLTHEIMRTYFIDRYFIVDTVLQGVYDANDNPLDVNEFTDSTLVFTKKAQSFTDGVDTRITYDRNTKKMTLNEIYVYASKFDKRAQFFTRGEGTCTEIKIKRRSWF